MAGTKSQGCRLWLTEDGGTTYTRVPNITQVNKPGASKERIDVSDLESLAKEYIAGLRDSNSVSYPINFDGTNAVHQNLLVLENSDDVVGWKIEFVEDGAATMTVVEFNGYVDNVDISAGVSSKQEGTLVIQPTGGNSYAHAQTAES